MANSKVALVRRVKTDAGWRYYPVAYASNGKVKPGVVIADGEEVKFPAGHYALRYYSGPKLVVEALRGVSPRELAGRLALLALPASAIVRGVAVDIYDPDSPGEPATAKPQATGKGT